MFWICIFSCIGDWLCIFVWTYSRDPIYWRKKSIWFRSSISNMHIFWNSIICCLLICPRSRIIFLRIYCHRAIFYCCSWSKWKWGWAKFVKFLYLIKSWTWSFQALFWDILIKFNSLDITNDLHLEKAQLCCLYTSFDSIKIQMLNYILCKLAME